MKDGKSQARRSQPVQPKMEKGGHAYLAGLDLFGLKARALKDARRRMQMIFQDPFSSLNPRRTAAAIIGQPLIIHKIGSTAQRRERVDQLMSEVGLDLRYRNRYPMIRRYRP